MKNNLPALTAKEQYDSLGVDLDEFDPVERLRAFCSFAMDGPDWLDVEPFFDAVAEKIQILESKEKE